MSKIPGVLEGIFMTEVTMAVSKLHSDEADMNKVYPKMLKEQEK